MMDLEEAKTKVKPLVDVLKHPVLSGSLGELPQCLVDRNPDLIEDRLFVDNDFSDVVQDAEFYLKPAVATGQEIDWPDLRGEILSEIRNRVFRQQTEDLFDSSDKLEFSKMRKGLLSWVHEKIKWDTPSIKKVTGPNTHIWESFSQDVELIMNSLLLEGAPHPLGELLLSVYKAGAFPCGWLGKYPEGHIIVFWPYEEDPVIEEKRTRTKA